MAHNERGTHELRRVVVATFSGTTIEWYDFFLCGTAAALLFNRLFFPMMYGPLAACLSELFGTRIRYTGASLVYQLTSAFAGGLSPFISMLLLARYGSGAVAAYIAACCAITLLAAFLAPETHRMNLDDGLHSSTAPTISV